MVSIPWLADGSDEFPPSKLALTDPNGLLAAGGDLRPGRILKAYSLGIFPWYSDGDPILWWTPNPRCVVFPDRAHCSKSLAKLMRKGTYQITFDKAFAQVIQLCGETREHTQGTWITAELKQAYIRLAELGFAHSVEVWRDEQLVGGLYGISLNQVFYGESMFSLEANTSKLAFITLCRRLQELNYNIVDCQVRSEHLISLGAVEISRGEFERIIGAEDGFKQPPKPSTLD